MAEYTRTRADQLGELDDEELAARVANARQELFNLRFQVVTGQLSNTARLGQLRRELAALLTTQRQREMALAEAYYLAAMQEGIGK